MPNQQLIEYIKQATEQGQSREQIKATLLGSGWHEGDIEMAFNPVIGTPVPQPPQVIASSFNNTQTASTVAPEVMYGGFWIRYIAFLLDGIIIALTIMLPIAVIVALVAFVLSPLERTSLTFSIFIIVMYILGMVLPYVYFIVSTNRRQATIGKRLLGLKVVSNDGSRLSLGKIILRETIGKIVSALILYIGFIMVAFTSKKQGLHDKFAGSVVISNPAERKTWAMVVAIIFAVVLPAIAIAIAILGIFALITLASLNSARATDSDAAVRANLSNIRAGAEIVFDRNGGYGNLLSDSAVVNSIRAAEAAAGAKAVINVTDTAHAIYLPLKHPTPPATGWCVDSTGFSQYSVSPGTATSCSLNKQSNNMSLGFSKESDDLVIQTINKYFKNVIPNTIYTVTRKITLGEGVIEDFVYTINVTTGKVTTIKATKGTASSDMGALRYGDILGTIEGGMIRGTLREVEPGKYQTSASLRNGLPSTQAFITISPAGFITNLDMYASDTLDTPTVKVKITETNNDFSRIVIEATYRDGSVLREVYTKK